MNKTVILRVSDPTLEHGVYRSILRIAAPHTSLGEYTRPFMRSTPFNDFNEGQKLDRHCVIFLKGDTSYNYRFGFYTPQQLIYWWNEEERYAMYSLMNKRQRQTWNINYILVDNRTVGRFKSQCIFKVESIARYPKPEKLRSLPLNATDEQIQNNWENLIASI